VRWELPYGGVVGSEKGDGWKGFPVGGGGLNSWGCAYGKVRAGVAEIRTSATNRVQQRGRHLKAKHFLEAMWASVLLCSHS
jgi:hypothetical protein